MNPRARLLISSLAVAALCACRREARPFRVDPPQANRVNSVSLVPLAPGGKKPAPGPHNAYEENAYALSEGQRLYSFYNCVGCHAHGGGGMGPPLMDSQWIYGSDPDQIFATIVQGRPNGMPSFRGHIPDFQVWQLVAYVRSMSGLVPFTAAPNRPDAMQGKKPENSVKPQPPVQSYVPPSAETK